MSVNDRWHKTYPRPGDVPCREHSRGRTKLYPTREHMLGDRWQVRWYDPDGKQRSRNFPLKEGKDPERHAEAFDNKTGAALDSGNYTDPKAAEGTFGAYAVKRLRNKRVTPGTMSGKQGLLRNHVLEDPGNPGRTPSGGPALGHHNWAALGRHVSITRDWMDGLTLAPSSATQVIRLVSSVFIAAMDDGLIGRNPTRADSVSRPKVVPRKAKPWMPGTVTAVAAGLAAKEERYGIIPCLGSVTAMRQGEMFGFAEEDIGDPEFFRRQLLVQVRRQVRLTGSVRCFAPVKNKKEHTVPVPAGFAEMLIAYMERFPPLPVTLPWEEPDGEPRTFRLIITRPDRQAVDRNGFNRDNWKPALAFAGIIPQRVPGGQWAAAPDDGCHRLRHTAVSHWLNEGVPIEAVAEWIGDTVEMVYKTYAHMVPGAEEKGREAMARFFARLGPGARHVHGTDAAAASAGHDRR